MKNGTKITSNEKLTKMVRVEFFGISVIFRLVIPAPARPGPIVTNAKDIHVNDVLII